MSLRLAAGVGESRLHVSDDFGAVMERLEGIARRIVLRGDEIEELGRVPSDISDELHAMGGYRLGIPSDLGGYEFSPTQLMRAVELLSHADAATGWVMMGQNTTGGFTAAVIPDAGASALYPDAASGDHATVCGEGARRGRAVRADGGYRVTGRWGFASGMSVSSWVLCPAYCEEEDRDLLLYVPKERVTIEGNWDVMGLKATNSVDYSIEDEFVSSDFVARGWDAEIRRGGAIYALGMNVMANMTHTAWALGVGGRALDELRDVAAAKHGIVGAATDTQHFWAEFAKFEARYRSSRSWAYEVWGQLEDALSRGELPSPAVHSMVHLVLNHVTNTVVEVVEGCYRWAGTGALRKSALQRVFRDIHAGSQHISVSQSLLVQVGKHLVGLAPTGHWRSWQLVEHAD